MRLRSILVAAGPAATVVVGGAGAAAADDYDFYGIEIGDTEITTVVNFGDNSVLEVD
ncbi:hypothetical protein AB0K92_28895 [Streptomyces sp. NPDC052687]|uniref:hypothetical protein n=1 Tax=Streptomyces sp. NPDC052687 TaxID=3154759 RepID=UPI0034450189